MASAVNSPITVISWSEFLADPGLMYGLFDNVPGVVSYSPEKVMVLVDNENSESARETNVRELTVNNFEELAHLKHVIFSRPIMLKTFVEHSRTSSYGSVRITTHWKGTFATLINTRHPIIQSQLEPQFQKAMAACSRGEKFCLEIDLAASLKQWYVEMLEIDDVCASVRTKTKCSRFYITNYAKYNHCFDCSVCWCVFCAPCWLVAAPIYKLQRKIKCTDIGLDVEAPVVMRTPLIRGHVVEIMPESQRHLLEEQTNRLVRASEAEPTIIARQPVQTRQPWGAPIREDARRPAVPREPWMFQPGVDVTARPAVPQESAPPPSYDEAVAAGATNAGQSET
ncbi:uncharacterized protein LOC135501322 [Lineus longissimus]|uniref:uncharacterized protein LOC135501322 n=1 Tax=Lineus longissimus TaxID=88925 RepID=UPI002B4ED298